jgi:hypothetical protein
MKKHKFNIITFLTITSIFFFLFLINLTEVNVSSILLILISSILISIVPSFIIIILRLIIKKLQ